jgi:hypothetical protein
MRAEYEISRSGCLMMIDDVGCRLPALGVRAPLFDNVMLLGSSSRHTKLEWG